MHRKTIGFSAAAVIAAILGPMGRFAAPGGVHRVTSDSKRGRQMTSRKTKVSSRRPHIGKKEQERAKRFYMVDTFPSGAKRSAPTMQQMSKRQYEAQLAQKAA
jgi:hypothetical protein